MEEMSVTMEPETEELVEYNDDNSNLVSGLIGVGIGVAGTLLVKKGVTAVKKLATMKWGNRKSKKSEKNNEEVEEEVDEDFDDFEEI